ncbi:transporter substrate-binding domain-containing protein [Streptoalloteichus hindustanus]|uniref:Extracellular solute-binding protein, family 3 n=1 Tax=Streptoalloteichus hindustanus TaxID=2017 RepID=A0A1M5B9G2_STRHI|nr:transporter substrate-binding domain-containing protein [Streptoalloteichus hindustanus]SHF39060.1 extracellular solute-binding protein, family 3 [Streptoalloteichus hindustanus]
MRKALVTLIAGVVAGVFFLLWWEGEKNDPPPRPPAQASAAPPTTATTTPPLVPNSPTYSRISQRGKLVVGVRANKQGWAFRDPNTQEHSGFEVEIARVLAAGLRVDPAKIEFKPLPGPLGVGAVASHDLDLLLGGAGESDAQQGRVALAGPYLVSGGQSHFVAVSAKDKPFQTKIDELLRAAVRDGRWQRAFDATLAPLGVTGTPPEVSSTTATTGGTTPETSAGSPTPTSR